MTKLGLILLLSLVAAPPAGLAHSHKKKGLEVIHPWTLAMEDPRTINIPVYMAVKNSGPSDERLLGASSPLAEKVEIIELRNDIGMTLPMVANALSVASGGRLELTPTGPRLLLSGVKRPLSAYDTFAMTLIFEHAGRIEVDVMVEETAATEPHKH